MRLTLPLKIAILAFTITFAGVGGVSYLSYKDTASLLRQQSIAYISGDVQRETSILAESLNKAREDVLFLGDAPPVLGIMRAIEGKGYDDKENMTVQLWRSRLEGLFKTILRQRKYYNQIRLIGIADKGREIVRVDRLSGDIMAIPQAELQEKESRPYFQAASGLGPGSVYFSETNLNYEHGKPTLPLMMTLRVAIPVFSSEKQIFGILVINLDFGYIANRLFSTEPVKSDFFIANGKGEYLFHKNEKKIFQFNRNGKGTRFSEDFPGIDFKTKGPTKTISNGITAGKPISQTTETEGITFEHLYFDPLDKNRFYLIGATVSHDTINASANAFRDRMLTLVMITAAVLGVVILAFSLVMTHPIRELAKYADRIAKGDENISFPAIGKDEVGILAKSIGAMYDRLEKNRNNLQKLAKSLEERVEQRTRQLSFEVEERKQTEKILRESESRFKQLFEKAPLGYQSLNEDGKFIEVNRAWLDMFGYNRDEVIGHSFEEFVIHEDFVKKTLPHFKETGEIRLTGTEMRCSDGTVKIVHIEGRIGYDKKGKFLQTHCILTDITERKKAEEKIIASLREKEVLLQEIHHRVKNNLQVVSSLLSLQAGTEKDKNIINALNESERRVRVMARVHENLYLAGDLANVSARDYLNAIAKDAKMSHPDTVGTVMILEDVDDITMDIKRAVPVGQIVSELISNVFKHAFPDAGEGTVKISLKRLNDTEVELVVSDDGIGLPEGFDFEDSDTLGLKLVIALAANLGGEIEVDTSRGTSIGIRFARGGNIT